MGTRFTRRGFLTAVGWGSSYLALAGTVGCGRLERSSVEDSSRTPRASPLRAPEVMPLPSAASRPPKEVWFFHSRPDLIPPAVTVTTQAHSQAPGYIFVAPNKGGTGQGGPMIIDDHGEVVWFHPHQGTLDLMVQTYRGERVLTWVEAPGQFVISDDSYREVTRFRAGNGYNGDHHEFLITPRDTALITIYNPLPRDLTALGGPRESIAWQGIVQELDIETGEVLFEWHSLDHVGLDETYVKPLETRDPGIDYFHINSIDVDHDNNLLVSARHTSAVYKIDRNTGDIIWRLGGKKSDFEMGEGARFAYQHDARRQRDGTITILDNGTTVFRNGLPKAVEESRGIVLELDEAKMVATLVREYTHPDKQYASAGANMQMLPNHNVFIGWGRADVFSEFSRDGKLLFSASFPSSFSYLDGTYRAFRFPWSGYPNDRPATVAERDSEDVVRVYASWNGATKVDAWEVLAGPRANHLESLGSVPRDGFETAMSVRTTEPFVAVRAKDASGRILGASKPVESKPNAAQGRRMASRVLAE